MSGGADSLTRRDSERTGDGGASSSPLGTSPPNSAGVITGLGQLRLRRSIEGAVPAAATLRPAASFTYIDRPLLSRLSGEHLARRATAGDAPQETQRGERSGQGEGQSHHAEDQQDGGDDVVTAQQPAESQERSQTAIGGDGPTARDGWGDFVG